MATFSILGIKLFSSRAENDMKDFFNRYEKILADQKTRAFDDIIEWGDQLIVNIQKYMEKQKFILEQDYKNQMESVYNTCKKFITELHIHEETNNTAEINQLVDRCNALRFKLASIQYHGQNVPFICLTREDVEFENSEKINGTISSKIEQRNDQRLIMEPLNAESRSSTHNSDTIVECPTCFMIFPSNMTSRDRTVHVNGHLTNK